MDAEEAAKREADERRDAGGFRDSGFYGWGGPGDGSRSRDEMRALDVLELDSDADFEAVKKSWRRLAKENHPDVKPGDANAAVRFQAIQAAYEVLKTAEERREWRPNSREKFLTVGRRWKERRGGKEGGRGCRLGWEAEK